MPKEKEEMSLKLMRHMLGSIDLSDVEDEKDMTESERQAYCAAIFAVYPRLEKDIKKMLYAQLMYVCNEAEIWERVIFGRGTFNGMDLLLEKWNKARAEYEAMPKKEEPFDKSNPISEI